MTAYTIPSGTSQKVTLTEGSYNFKASAPRARNLEGQELFQKGYVCPAPICYPNAIASFLLLSILDLNSKGVK